MDALTVWRNPAWEDVPGLAHGFFGRTGGSSRGDFATLNLGARCGDDEESVARNWSRVRMHLDLPSIASMDQVHGARVLRLAHVDAPASESDGLTGDLRGVGLAVLVADCVPILMLARRVRAVSAVHAGWRGTLAGIAAIAVEQMCAEWSIAPEEVEVALGPSIGGCCYEVESQLARRFEQRWGALHRAWRPHGERGQLDLREVNRAILERIGVAPDNIVTLGPCTACRTDLLFSHRASGGRAGRQVAVIGWR